MITLHTLTKHPLLKGDTHFSIQIVTSCYLFMLPKIFFSYIRKREIVCATIVSSLIVFTTLLYYAHSFFFISPKEKGISLFLCFFSCCIFAGSSTLLQFSFSVPTSYVSVIVSLCCRHCAVVCSSVSML